MTITYDKDVHARTFRSRMATCSGQSRCAGPSAEATVTIVNIAFDPPKIEVAAGTTVTWTNREAIPHTVTASDAAFDSGILEASDAFRHTFDTAGAFDYACAIHPGMTASVTVTA